MPAKSKSQQRFFGMVSAAQDGKLKTKKLKDAERIKDVADDMTEKDVDKFAETKHKGLPEKVKKKVSESLESWNDTFNQTYSDLKESLERNQK